MIQNRSFSPTILKRAKEHKRSSATCILAAHVYSQGIIIVFTTNDHPSIDTCQQHGLR